MKQEKSETSQQYDVMQWILVQHQQVDSPLLPSALLRLDHSCSTCFLVFFILILCVMYSKNLALRILSHSCGAGFFYLDSLCY